MACVFWYKTPFPRLTYEVRPALGERRFLLKIHCATWYDVRSTPDTRVVAFSIQNPLRHLVRRTKYARHSARGVFYPKSTAPLGVTNEVRPALGERRFLPKSHCATWCDVRSTPGTRRGAFSTQSPQLRNLICGVTTKGKEISANMRLFLFLYLHFSSFCYIL